ncbi:hypothetical protein ABT187_43805 [Streptomyces sp. NPDC001817]|uniref:hypothetical protein n=1 Tax=Streptomyces sp. NPDC001817 TaxID=3154398 RepID=UPI003330F00D
MSERADLTVARYLEQDREAARAYHLDPQVHADVERLRQFVGAREWGTTPADVHQPTSS